MLILLGNHEFLHQLLVKSPEKQKQQHELSQSQSQNQNNIQRLSSIQSKLDERERICENKFQQCRRERDMLRQKILNVMVKHRVLDNTFGDQESSFSLGYSGLYFTFRFYGKKVIINANLLQKCYSISIDGRLLCDQYQYEFDSLLVLNEISPDGWCTISGEIDFMIDFVNEKLVTIFSVIDKFQFDDEVLDLSNKYNSISSERDLISSERYSVERALDSIHEEIEKEPKPFEKCGCPNEVVYNMIRMEFTKLIMYFSKDSSQNSNFVEFMRFAQSKRGGDIWYGLPGRQKACVYLRDLTMDQIECFSRNI